MTDKERLERLVKISNNVSLNGAHSTHLKLTDLLFLIEQAERVQGLEEICDSRIKDHARLHVANRGLKKESDRLREALEFYAEEDIYEWETYYNPQQQMDCMVIDDGGHKARQALEQSK